MNRHRSIRAALHVHEGLRLGGILPAATVRVSGCASDTRAPESRRLAEEIDFLVTHIYAMWNGLPLDRALPWTQKIYKEFTSMQPDLPVVIGEAGWATRKHTEGEQVTLINGTPGAEEQKRFYDTFTEWIEREKLTAFSFEAFDENRKGGNHPDEVERYWGLFWSDRSAKEAVSERK